MLGVLEAANGTRSTSDQVPRQVWAKFNVFWADCG